MINNVVLVGRITKDIDLRMSESGKAYTNFTLAVNRAFKGQDRQQQADFISCKTFNKQAENLARYCGKGSLIAVVGSIQVGNFQGKDGNTVYRTEVIANNIQFLDTRNQGQQQQQPTNNNFNNFNQQPNAIDVINQQHQQQGMNFNNTGLRNNNTVFDNFGNNFNPNDFMQDVVNPFTNE
jgi:single stranded DNA-binding protein (ssb)|nr:MAG TPA: Single strand binding protein [Caudoviricetes sp.]